MNWQLFFDVEIFGNSIKDYLLSLEIFFGVIVILKIIEMVFFERLKAFVKKTENDVDDFIFRLISKIHPVFYFIVALYFASKFLILHSLIEKSLYFVFILFLVFQVIILLQIVVDYIVVRFIFSQKKKLKNNGQGLIENKQSLDDKKTVMRFFSRLLKVALWILGIILILSNLNINVTSLVAGLGIGGVAVALALQNILSDLFSSFSILIDKPFKVGDFISLDKESGTVKRIGIKTTRIITLEGEEVVIPNKNLTESRIHNFRKLEKRRVIFDLGLAYENSFLKLKKVPSILEEIINEVSLASFNRAHFKKYNDYSLEYQVAFTINSSKYEVYLNVRNQINLAIFEKFKREGIEFAYPTNKIILAKKI